MSGIAGCFIFNPRIGEKNVQIIIDEMLSELKVGGEQKCRSYTNETDLCLGVSNSNSVITAVMFEDQEYVLCANGYFYNKEEIARITTSTGSGQAQKIEADNLLRLYKLKGCEIVNFLNGVYVIIVWNKKKNELNIFTDRHGYEFVYYYQDKSKFVFASEIKPILRQIKDKASASIDAICDIYNYGTAFGNRTPIHQINLLPNAAISTVSKEKTQINKYWDYPSRQNHFEKDESTLQEEAKAVLSSAVAGALAGANDTGIMLSGGLDSRLLAAIAQPLHATLKAFSFDFKEVDSHEYMYAKKIAEKLGLGFEHINDAENESLAEQVRKTLLECDGNWGFYEFIPYMKMIAERHPGIFIMNGFLLDTFFKSGWAFFPTENRKMVTNELIANKYTTIPAYLQKKMFTSEFYDNVQNRKLETVREINEGLPHNMPAEISIRFYCLNRGRRAHNTILKAFRRYVNLVIPGADYRLTDFSFGLPYRLRSTPKFYLDLICKWFPDVAQVPWDKTEKPLTMGLPEKNKKFENLLFKTKYYTQRLSRGKVDLLNKSHSFNKMLRRNKEFMNQVKAILLDSKSVSRGYFKRENVELLIRDQMVGRDLSFAFKALISVEMMHRTMLD